MYDLTIRQNNLPDTLEDLVKFSLFGREKLVSVRAEIRAIDKLKLADDVRAKKIEEAQGVAEAVMDAEVRVGELLSAVPKATTNNPSGANQYQSGQKDTAVPLTTPKQQSREAVGITRKQADRFVKLAQNKEIVEQAKIEARENDDIVSRSFALEKIKAAERERRRETIETLKGFDTNSAFKADSPLFLCFSNVYNYNTMVL